MPRVHHVEKARKDNPAVKKGKPYYWWKFRFGGKRFSISHPKRSQLTQSEYFAAFYDFEDEFGDIVPDGETIQNICSSLDDIACRIRELGDEQREKKENMPEGLQEGDVGQLLEERADACDVLADEIEDISSGVDNENEEEALELLRGEIESIDWSSACV